MHCKAAIHKDVYAPQTDTKIKYAPVINIFRELKVCKEGPISKRKGTVLVVEARPYHTSTPRELEQILVPINSNFLSY
ncbi:hypothetical protein NC653_032015 [Populus alba x Populus x berolinensis]|uniref:Uncharacterized protein n=1 Tax=Populus alba x Populus x berolinensis TaxID=444605 RepID=A0AAD6LQI8_9ROSI|nr:hypothetical protein NC653_032015 [Populus alba x Populus x berolinensis]